MKEEKGLPEEANQKIAKASGNYYAGYSMIQAYNSGLTDGATIAMNHYTTIIENREAAIEALDNKVKEQSEKIEKLMGLLEGHAKERWVLKDVFNIKTPEKTYGEYWESYKKEKGI